MRAGALYFYETRGAIEAGLEPEADRARAGVQGVRNSDALRAAAAAVQPRATAVTQRFAQSPALFAAFQALRVGPLWADLPRARRTIVDKQLLGFRLAGVNLEVRPY